MISSFENWGRGVKKTLDRRKKGGRNLAATSGGSKGWGEAISSKKDEVRKAERKRILSGREAAPSLEGFKREIQLYLPSKSEVGERKRDLNIWVALL